MSGELWVACGGLVVAALGIVSGFVTANRTERAADRRHAADRFRAERLAAYSAFLGRARQAYREGWLALGSRTGEPLADEGAPYLPDGLAPGDVNAELSDLAAPIRLLSPSLVQAARDVEVGLTLFLLDVANRDPRAARVDDPAAELNDFEAAAAADLALPARRPRRRWGSRRA